MTVYYPDKTYIVNTCFRNNTNITDVDCSYTPWHNNSMIYAFLNCTSLTSVTNINTYVNNGYAMFQGCTSMVTSPTIPNSIVDMTHSFYGCSNLETVTSLPYRATNYFNAFVDCKKLSNVPTIPGNATNCCQMFANCNSLTTLPNLTNGIKDISYICFQCPNLTTVSNIPATVTTLYASFYSCNNVTGNIYIDSTEIANADFSFTGTTKTRRVFLPLTYENGVNTKTYNAFLSAGYSTTTVVNGVTIYDRYTKTYNDYLYSVNKETDKATLLYYTGSGTTLTVPNSVEEVI